MKKRFVFPLCLILLLLFACIRHGKNTVSKANENHPFPKIKLKHAKGFEIQYRGDSAVVILTKDPNTNKIFDSIYIAKNQNNSFPWPLKKVGIQSTTYFSFLHFLGKVDQIVAVCGKQFFSENQQKMLNDSTIEICNGTNFEFEKLANLQPNVMFLYPFESKGVEKFNKLGINTLFVSEYLEKTPLARAEWLKFFGFLTNSSKASGLYNQIEKSYNTLKKPHTDATVAFNLPFKDKWNMPSGNALTATLVKDAGFDYLLSEVHSLGNQTLSLEKAYTVLAKADFWIIVTNRPKNYSLKDLMAENPIYATFPSVKKKNVIVCNVATNAYFSRGILEPQIMLKDLLFCKGEFVDSTYIPTYFKLLE